MSFALLQTQPETPTLNQLKRAFRALPHLRDLDAVTSFNDAYGIILRGLELDQAQVLQAALEHEDVPAQAVDEAELPTLPLGHAIIQIQFHPDQFTAIDPLGRVFQVPWNQLLLVTAGLVAPSPLVRARRLPEFKADSHNGAEEQEQFLVDLFLTGATQRFTLSVDKFDFSYLGARKTDQLSQDLAFLVQDLIQFAPGAGLTRGAVRFRDEPQSPHLYPRRSAYQEEIIWMLWLSSQAAAS